MSDKVTIGIILMTSRYSFDRPAVYHIRLQGRRPQAWAYAAAGLVADMKIEVTKAAGGVVPAGEEPITALRGEVADQAALYGLLNQLYALRLTILSVVRIEGALGR